MTMTKVIIRHLTHCSTVTPLLNVIKCSFNLDSCPVCSHQSRWEPASGFQFPETSGRWDQQLGSVLGSPSIQTSGGSDAKTADGWLIDHFSFSLCPLLTYGIGSLWDNAAGDIARGSWRRLNQSGHRLCRDVSTSRPQSALIWLSAAHPDMTRSSWEAVRMPVRRSD